MGQTLQERIKEVLAWDQRVMDQVEQYGIRNLQDLEKYPDLKSEVYSALDDWTDDITDGAEGRYHSEQMRKFLEDLFPERVEHARLHVTDYTSLEDMQAISRLVSQGTDPGEAYNRIVKEGDNVDATKATSDETPDLVFSISEWKNLDNIATTYGWNTALQMVADVMHHPEDYLQAGHPALRHMAAHVNVWGPWLQELVAYGIDFTTGGVSDLVVKILMGRTTEINASDIAYTIADLVGAVGLGKLGSALGKIPIIGSHITSLADDVVETAGRFGVTDRFAEEAEKALKKATRVSGEDAARMIEGGGVGIRDLMYNAYRNNVLKTVEDGKAFLVECGLPKNFINDVMNIAERYVDTPGGKMVKAIENIEKKYVGGRLIPAEWIGKIRSMDYIGPFLSKMITPGGVITTAIATLGVSGTVGMMPAWGVKETFIEPIQFNMRDAIGTNPQLAEALLKKYIDWSLPGMERAFGIAHGIPILGRIVGAAYEPDAYWADAWIWIASLQEKYGLSDDFVNFLGWHQDDPFFSSDVSQSVIESINKGDRQFAARAAREKLGAMLSNKSWQDWSDAEKEMMYSFLLASGNAYEERQRLNAPGMDLVYIDYENWIKTLGTAGKRMSDYDISKMVESPLKRAEELRTTIHYDGIYKRKASAQDVEELLALEDYLTQFLEKNKGHINASLSAQIEGELAGIKSEKDRYTRATGDDISKVSFASMDVPVIAEIEASTNAGRKLTDQWVSGSLTNEQFSQQWKQLQVQSTQGKQPVSSSGSMILDVALWLTNKLLKQTGETDQPPTLQYSEGLDEKDTFLDFKKGYEGKPPEERSVTGKDVALYQLFQKGAQGLEGMGGGTGIAFSGQATKTEAAQMKKVTDEYTAGVKKLREEGWTDKEARLLYWYNKGPEYLTLNEIKKSFPDLYAKITEREPSNVEFWRGKIQSKEILPEDLKKEHPEVYYILYPSQKLLATSPTGGTAPPVNTAPTTPTPPATIPVPKGGRLGSETGPPEKDLYELVDNLAREAKYHPDLSEQDYAAIYDVFAGGARTGGEILLEKGAYGKDTPKDERLLVAMEAAGYSARTVTRDDGTKFIVWGGGGK